MSSEETNSIFHCGVEDDPFAAYFRERRSTINFILKENNTTQDSIIPTLPVKDECTNYYLNDNEINENDPFAAFYKERLKLRKESVASSTLSLSSLSLCPEQKADSCEKELRTADFNEVTRRDIENISSKLQKYSTSSDIESRISLTRSKAKSVLETARAAPERNVLNELFTYNGPPQTPRLFQDQLDSLVADTPCVFPVNKKETITEKRQQDDFSFLSTSAAMRMFEEDEKENRANSSRIRHDSNLSLSLGRQGPVVEADRELSIGQYFQQRSESIAPLQIPQVTSLPVENNTNFTTEKNAPIMCGSLKARYVQLNQSTPKVQRIKEKIGNPWRHLTDNLVQCDGSSIASLIANDTTIKNITSPASPFNNTLTNVTNEQSPISAIVTVSQKLFNIPPGDVDTSAMIKYISEHQPELIPANDSILYSLPVSQSYSPSILKQPSPTSWIKLSSEPICVQLNSKSSSTACIPVGSIDKWLQVSVASAEVEGVTVSGADVILPPGVNHQLQVKILTKRDVTGKVRVKLCVMDLLKDECVEEITSLLLCPYSKEQAVDLSVRPLKIHFDTLPQYCSDQKRIELRYHGDRDMLIHVFITQDGPYEQFVLDNEVTLNNVDISNAAWPNQSLKITLAGGKESLLTLIVGFTPSESQPPPRGSLSSFGDLHVEEITSSLSAVELIKVPLQASVALGKFLHRMSCPPVFETSTNVPVTHEMELKNVGAMALNLRLRIAPHPDDGILGNLFLVPQDIFLPLGEVASFDITFTADTTAPLTQRTLEITMVPNGKVVYSIDLIAKLSKPDKIQSVPSSATSVRSGFSSNKLPDGEPIKLASSHTALSWCATPLQQPSVLSFQVKVSANAPVLGRLAISKESDSFMIINEKGESLFKLRKTFIPGIATVINVRFRPNSIGLHRSQLDFEFNNSTKPTFVMLTGFGGGPDLRIEDTITDYHENKIVKLGRPASEGSTLYSTKFRITNYGNAPGFVIIRPTFNALSIGHEMRVYPTELVVEANSNVIVSINQNLTKSELLHVLSGRDVRKIATLNVTLGDETSRMRLKQYVETNKGSMSESMRCLINKFPGETPLQCGTIIESKDFMSVFHKVLTLVEVAVVLEKNAEWDEQTMDDLEMSTATFKTLTAGAVGVDSAYSEWRGSLKNGSTRSRSPDASYDSTAFQENAMKVSKWLHQLSYNTRTKD